MKIFWIILLGSLIGLLIGGFIGWFGVLWVGSLIYGNLEQGALIVIQTAPIGALIGTIAGLIASAAWQASKNHRSTDE